MNKENLIRFCLKIMRLSKEGYSVTVAAMEKPESSIIDLMANWTDKKTKKLKYFAVKL